MRRVALLAFAASVALPGCAPAPSWRSGAAIPEPEVKRMQPGRTTKSELLEAFGMPVGIAKKGEPLVVAHGNEWAGSGTRLGGFQVVDADTFFELFAARRPGPHHRIYYYRQRISSKHAIVLGLYVRESVNLRSTELWVLVNEASGTVEDFVHRPAT